MDKIHVVESEVMKTMCVFIFIWVVYFNCIQYEQEFILISICVNPMRHNTRSPPTGGLEADSLGLKPGLNHTVLVPPLSHVPLTPKTFF